MRGSIPNGPMCRDLDRVKEVNIDQDKKRFVLCTEAPVCAAVVCKRSMWRVRRGHSLPFHCPPGTRRGHPLNAVVIWPFVDHKREVARAGEFASSTVEQLLAVLQCRIFSDTMVKSSNADALCSLPAHAREQEPDRKLGDCEGK